MSNAPSDRRQLIAWATNRTEKWVDNAASIGLTPAQANAAKSALESATASLAAADLARTNAKSSTTAYYASVTELRAAVSEVVRTVTNFAKSNNSEMVYALADLNPPKPRGDSPPPARPTDIEATLTPIGELRLTWKCSNPTGVSGVIYQIRRALGTTPTMTLIDTVGEREFYDNTIPLGTTTVRYVITGKRGRQTGPDSAVFYATFGVAVGPGDAALRLITSSTEPPAGLGKRDAA